MIWTGLFLLGFAGYRLFVTDLLNARSQEVARQELAVDLVDRRADLAAPIEIETSPESPEVDAPEEEPIVHYPETAGEEGTPLGTIRIPKIGLDEVMFEGITPSTLQLGPGHMPWTPVPGQPGNSVVSGHRTTYGRPFFDLDQLEPGDTIEVETAIGTHTFTVRESIVVTPFDVWVTEARLGAWLTLTTCNPKYSARERLIVFAELTDGPNMAYAEYLMSEELEAVS